MIIKTRRTITGVEYWDAKAKKVIVVPHGQKSPFEVVENPDSMIHGVDLVIDKDKTVNNNIVVDTVDNLDEMNADQLLAYAKENNIDVPGNMKKADTIRDHIKEEQDKAIEE